MNSKNKIYLNCPYKDREECKKLGGKWDKEVKKWYITEDIDKSFFFKWITEKNVNTINDNEKEVTYLEEEVEELKSTVIDMYEHVSSIYKIISNRDEESETITSTKTAMEQYHEAINELKESNEYSKEEWDKFFKVDIESMAFIGLSDDIKNKLIN